MSTRLSDKNWSLEDTTISIEEFDAIDGSHEFSKAYQDKKEALLLQVKEREKVVLKKTLAKIAAVIKSCTYSCSCLCFSHRKI